MSEDNVTSTVEYGDEDANLEGYKLTPAYIFYSIVEGFNLNAVSGFKALLYDAAYNAFLNSMINAGYINRTTENDDRTE